MIKSNNIRVDWNIFFAVIISLTAVVYFLSPLLINVINTPKDAVNLWVGHYFEDYFEYLSFIKQGTQGKFLYHNLFTNNDNSLLSVPWWPYWLIGYLGFISHLKITPEILYWLASSVLIMIYLVLSYKVITGFLGRGKRSLVAFLLYLCASGIYIIGIKGGFNINPYDFWYSIGPPQARFNIGTPHHQLTHIFFILAILIILAQSKKPEFNIKKMVLFSLVILVLVFLSPLQILLLFLALALTIFTGLVTLKFNYKIYLPYLYLTFLTMLLSLIINSFLLSSPTMISVKKWDIEHLFYPSLRIFILTMGPALILGMLGVYKYLKNADGGKYILFFVTMTSFFLILVPIPNAQGNIFTRLGFHNLRFQTPMSFIFLSISAIEFLATILKKPIFFRIGIIILLCYFSPVLISSWKNSLNGFQSLAYLNYMPEELYRGVKTLEKSDKGGTVLTSIQSFLGLAVPGISGRKVYFGRSIFTLDIAKKAGEVNNFYALTMEKETTKRFIQKEKIDSILLFWNDPIPERVISAYPFLELVFRNRDIAVLAPIKGI
jgi:hypothetical protein